MAGAKTRTEKDSLGDIQVPAEAYWGAQTQRAVENFPISGLRFPRRFLRAMGLTKKAAAQTNLSTKDIEPDIGKAIMEAAGEVAEGRLDGQFVVDIFQTGSGTSTNMNANEVIANRASEIMGKELGSKFVHPNDHVNRGQSSNDIIPTVMHIATAEAIDKDLKPALEEFQKALDDKAVKFDSIVKIGRTHLQDAVPVRLGQEFSGYSAQAQNGLRRLASVMHPLCELALGGTAVGTGLNADPKFAPAVIKLVAQETGIPLKQAPNLFEALAGRDAMVEASGALRTLAVSLIKIANDIRWLGSGPRCGLGELKLPDLQPGSSIMPGKVNPVMSEMMMMVGAQVLGNDASVAFAGTTGSFELNVMKPVIAYNVLQSIEILSQALTTFSQKCLRDLEADEERCRDAVEKSLAMCTSLAPEIGYDAAAAIAKEAYSTGKTVREICIQKKILPLDKLEEILDARKMTGA